MEEKTVSFDEMKKELKREQLKRKVKAFGDSVKSKAEAAASWCIEHPTETIGILTGLGMTARKALKYGSERAEKHRRETNFFEHSSGKWAESKRKLTAREQLEAETRHRNGETWTQILSDMNLLK